MYPAYFYGRGLVIVLLESRSEPKTISLLGLPHDISLRAAMDIPPEDAVWRQELLVTTGCAITAPHAIVCKNSCFELQEEYEPSVTCVITTFFCRELTMATGAFTDMSVDPDELHRYS